MSSTVLIVDDAANMRRLLSYNLEKQYTVKTASDGVEALSMIRNGVEPNIIVADIMMPNMDGLELLQQLRACEQYKDIPVILLSAKSKSTDRIDGLKQGADDYITKPFNPEELLIRIEKILKRGNVL